MRTLQRTKDCTTLSIQTANLPFDELLEKEWLLTNGSGGYAASSIIGCNTRRYHGLLIGSLNPPVNRVMALANCMEMVVRNGRVFNLAGFEFEDKIAPEGVKYLKQFRKDTAVHFDYEIDNIHLTKSVYLLRDSNTVAVGYDFSSVTDPFDFIVRPFVGLRDFHLLQKSYAPLVAKPIDDGVLVRHDVPASCELRIKCPDGSFEKDRQWWFNFVYRWDQRRGQEFTEDLWTPGFFRWTISEPRRVLLWANLSTKVNADEEGVIDLDSVNKELQDYDRHILANTNGDTILRTLCRSADQFVTTRCHNGDERTTILAGYPWFADWGRDTFIALPGLLLATKRYDEAREALVSFAKAASDGMIPNRFDDYDNAAHFNSVDASLWFVNAAFDYLKTTNDAETFNSRLLSTVRRIIDSYRKGTRFGICADEDGLINAGNAETQLTWMDAKYADTAFTPRYGKPVEVNALWYNALMLLAEYSTEYETENMKYSKYSFHSLASNVRQSFNALFWNDELGRLNDCILPDGTVDSSMRPNQIFAVSLPFSPLTPARQAKVVKAVEKELLTPYGLRTLSPADKRYVGTYTGPQHDRDRAYHQGTVWPYLMGPFIEAYLRVNRHSRKAKKQASCFIRPLLEHLTNDACIGQLSEIFDADPPHRPRGCFAQAWSVAELIRAYLLINS
ncbi:MAG: glycogen debranching enzyme family protein [Sedimentisphaerales bacterium]|nr:glycogen debranching enzyme family protein [Sedimentisphaerales bacterium]